MAEKRARSGKNMNRITYQLPTESSKSIEQINAERDDEVWKSSMERAVRIAHFMHMHFPDITDGSNTSCGQYVERLRAAVPDDFDGRKAVAAGPGGDAAGPDGVRADYLAGAIRAAMPDAPAADADIEDCEAFAGRLAGIQMQSVTGHANVGKMLRSACPDLPGTEDADACKAYIERLAEDAAKAAGMEARLAQYERMFGRVMATMPDECEDDEEKMRRFETAWSEYLSGSLSDIRDVVRGAMKDD